MPDITLCVNKSCPYRNTCYRAQAKPGELQSWSEFLWVEGVGCAFYIECRSKAQFKRLKEQTK